MISNIVLSKMIWLLVFNKFVWKYEFQMKIWGVYFRNILDMFYFYMMDKVHLIML